MNNKPTVSRITIYPVKSLDGVEVQKAMIVKGGCLAHDREFAILDMKGNFIIGKSNPLVHLLRSSIDLEKEVISFRHQEESSWNHFHLENDKNAIDAYLTQFFHTPCILHQNKEGRFLDIPDVSGSTVLSTESLNAVTGWFKPVGLEEIRRRFRATIEIEGVDAFWEDRLFSEEGTGIEFTIGAVTLIGMSPRARCVVPTRNPETGEVTHAFAKTFAKKRLASIPSWSTLKTYGHYYHLSVDCHFPLTEVGKWIHTGDEVTIVGERIFW